MAKLNHAKIIKGFEELINTTNGTDFFVGFLKAFSFPASTIRNVQDPNNGRNIAVAEGDFGLAKNMYFRPVADGQDVHAVVQELIRNTAIAKQKVRFFMATDFKRMAAYDARVDDWSDFDFCDLMANYEFFLPLTGLYEKPLAYTSHPADVKACEKMGKLYDIIRATNHYDDEHLHDLNVFLTRLLFCFFAEDTGIFPIKGQMTKAIESLTNADGSDMQSFFERLFWMLDMAPDRYGRKQETATLAAFPYVNGGLFRDKIHIPTFNARARNILLECGRLEWNQISPVIFGSMFQAVMKPEERHSLGAHYTSEQNILKVIGPLFLDDLRAELDELLLVKRDQKRRLSDFQKKLSSLTFLDPACGSGNFLVVAYRELKKLELEVVKVIKGSIVDRSIFDDWKGEVSKVSISQFYGIEIEEFPVSIARVSMWLMEHVMNLEFGKTFGAVFPSIPLHDSAHIVCANALQTNWDDVISSDRLSYIMGNPPFCGSLVMTKTQKEDVLNVCNGISVAKSFDYVVAWYFKAKEQLEKNAKIKVAFVSTNSICQGEQVYPLWNQFFKDGIRINFAHQTFKWSNEAKANAGVNCVIIGYGKIDSTRKLLYKYKNVNSEPEKFQVQSINGYLIEGGIDTLVKASPKPLSMCNDMTYGCMPRDGGYLIVEDEEFNEIRDNKEVLRYTKKMMGSKELLHSIPRYCFWLTSITKERALSIPFIGDRVKKCEEFRLKSTAASTRNMAETAHLFAQRTQPENCSCIVIPRHSSERRLYIPMGFVNEDTIVADSCQIVPNGTLYDFGILESRMHMTWMRTVCGRLESRYRYSRDLCYNTFPWPDAKETQRQVIEVLAQNVLDARDLYPELTLADLYDPDKMPRELKDAHEHLDRAVDQLYRTKPFENDEERLQMLFEKYEKLVASAKEETAKKGKTK